MENSIEALVSLVEERTRNNPEERRIWATATISYKFAALVSSLRKNNGWTEEDLAKKMDCPFDTVVALENPNAENIPSLDIMVSATEALGYELELNINPLRPEVTLDDIDESVYSTLVVDVQEIGKHHLSSPEFNESISVVLVDAGGNVRLPRDVVVQEDNEAFFHSIPIRVISDDS